MKNLKVSLKGPFLPSIGGISIHISRLSELLSDEGLLSCVYSTSTSKSDTKIVTRFRIISAFYKRSRYEILASLLWFIQYGIKDKSDIIHLHGNPIWESPTIFLSLLLRKKLVYTIHDQMMFSNLKKYPKPLLYLFKKTLINKNIHWIAVSLTIRSQIEKINENCTNLSVIPAYIQSLPNDTSLNNEIEDFIKSRSQIVSIYANSTRTINGRDLYGIDLALKAIAFVKSIYLEIGLIVIITGKINNDIVDEYYKIINELQITKNVLLFLESVKNPLKLWERSDIVLRPTLTDGDSLVIREALSLGTFVIASDSVRRPENVILFKSESVEDLSLKIIEVLRNAKDTVSEPDTSNYELIKSIYYNFH